MTKEQRRAKARIVSDMIKADNNIEEKGINDMKILLSEHAITLFVYSNQYKQGRDGNVAI
ncbi:MAG: hypothetical protein J6T52_02205 [Bacteroidaceae bacterium]|nr:hypothetical protein [Bacteroidaceae bacterium]